jgi:hypothetical protein
MEMKPNRNAIATIASPFDQNFEDLTQHRIEEPVEDPGTRHFAIH